MRLTVKLRLVLNTFGTDSFEKVKIVNIINKFILKFYRG